MSSRAVRRSFVVTLALLAVLLVRAAPVSAAVVGPPTGLTAVTGNGQVALSWTAPTVGGNPAISDYVVEYSTDLGNSWAQFIHQASVSTTMVITSLTNGVAHAFRVTAINSDGAGPASTAVAATPISSHTPNDLPTFSACPPGIAPSAGFGDTTSTDVDWVAYYGVTKGTTATTYSPYAPVTRWQMALFLTRMAGPAGITLPNGSDQGFTDISGESAEIRTAINQIRQLDITVGKTATTYAPADNVTREEMALFISRFLTKATPGPGGNIEFVSGSSGATEIKSNDTDFNFTDINQGTMEIRAAIINLWNLGATDVQNHPSFEPTVVMTRIAMAAFIDGALAHTNARPKGLNMQASTYRAQGTPLVSFSVSHRSDSFSPIAASPVDTFKFTHTLLTTVTRFDTAGKCMSALAPTTATFATTVGNNKCTVDGSDPVTNGFGNVATFTEVMPNANQQDLWAWTAPVGTFYDNDDHAVSASKVTIETYP